MPFSIRTPGLSTNPFSLKVTGSFILCLPWGKTLEDELENLWAQNWPKEVDNLAAHRLLKQKKKSSHLKSKSHKIKKMKRSRVPKEIKNHQGANPLKKEE